MLLVVFSLLWLAGWYVLVRTSGRATLPGERSLSQNGPSLWALLGPMRWQFPGVVSIDFIAALSLYSMCAAMLVEDPLALALFFPVGALAFTLPTILQGKKDIRLHPPQRSTPIRVVALWLAWWVFVITPPALLLFRHPLLPWALWVFAICYGSATVAAFIEVTD